MKLTTQLMVLSSLVFAAFSFAEPPAATPKKLTRYSRQAILLEVLQGEALRKAIAGDETLKTLDLGKAVVNGDPHEASPKFGILLSYTPTGDNSVVSCELRGTAVPTTKKHPTTKISYTELVVKFEKPDCVN